MFLRFKRLMHFKHFTYDSVRPGADCPPSLSAVAEFCASEVGAPFKISKQ